MVNAIKPKNSNTALYDGASPLPRWPAFWRRVGLLVGALAGVAWISAATIDQDREPNFDFSQLGRDNVLLNGSLSLAQENRLRMNYVQRAAPFDVVLIGSHNLRGFGGQFSAPLGRFFLCLISIRTSTNCPTYFAIWKNTGRCRSARSSCQI